MIFNTLSTGYYSMNIDLLYQSNEYSIDISNYDEIKENVGYSILINDLQLEIGDKGLVLYPWGYCPLVASQTVDLEIPEYSIGKLFVELDQQLQVGCSIRYNSDVWRIYNDNGLWFCIGNSKLPKEYTGIEFCPNCIAVIEDHRLVSLYLKPIII